MRASLQAAIEEALDCLVRRGSSVGGGDINEGYVVELEDGQRVFVKANRTSPQGMFEAEALGLAWLRAADAIRIPAVLAHRDGEESILVLEYLASAQRVPSFDELLGRRLAALHRHAPTGFGLDHDNFIGRLHQQNAPLPDWPAFYWTRRLEPQARQAFDSGILPAGVMRDLQQLENKLEHIVGEPEPPARLHGDLWGGNLHTDELGEPVLIDPAVYGGHREVDLAMMRLFGGFGERVFSGYDEAHPLQPGAADRVALYQLYPLLVHVNLFGSGYVSGVERALRRYL